MSILLDHAYPGNVRELENIIERAISFANTPEILPVDLPEFLRLAPAKPRTKAASLRLKEALNSFERETISNALIEYSGNISRAASALGVYRQQLQRKIKQYKIAT
jgi:transcriptional regulator with PAS, ATPase and Fis domain